MIAWLKENQQVRIICRDRGPGYGVAATEAAPQARQVADRWHLFENASAAFLAAVRSELPRLRKALSPERPVDPETLSKAERIQWERDARGRQRANSGVGGARHSAQANGAHDGRFTPDDPQDRARTAPRRVPNAPEHAGSLARSA